MFVSYHVFYTQEEYNRFIDFLRQRKAPYGLYAIRMPNHLRHAGAFAAMRLVLYRLEDYDVVVNTFGGSDTLPYDDDSEQM